MHSCYAKLKNTVANPGGEKRTDYSFYQPFRLEPNASGAFGLFVALSQWRLACLIPSRAAHPFRPNLIISHMAVAMNCLCHPGTPPRRRPNGRRRKGWFEAAATELDEFERADILIPLHTPARSRRRPPALTRTSSAMRILHFIRTDPGAGWG